MISIKNTAQKKSQSLRIVSLVPSLTETLCDLGLQNSIVGCTNFCVSPKSLRKSALAVGGTKDPDLQKIILLRPTHIITNHEENTTKILEALKEEKALKETQIIESFPKNLEDTISLVTELGSIFSCENFVKKWSESVFLLKEECLKINKNTPVNFLYSYFIWRNPWMVAGDKTYIASMLSLIGLQNAIITQDTLQLRYPVVEPQDERLKNANIIFFSSEPFPFKERHIEEFRQTFVLPEAQCIKVDGQNLSWYGTRTLECLSYLLNLRTRMRVY